MAVKIAMNVNNHRIKVSSTINKKNILKHYRKEEVKTKQVHKLG